MARKPRLLTASETRGLEKAILDTIPESQGRAITRQMLFQRLAKHLRNNQIPASLVVRHVHSLRKANKLKVSTRVGMWRGDSPTAKSAKVKGSLRFPMRRIRRVTSFVCTRCFHAFPSKAAAKEHLATHGR